MAGARVTGAGLRAFARSVAVVAAALLATAAPAARAQHAGDAVRVNGVGISNERVDRFVVEYLAQKGRNPQAIRHPDAYRQYRREAIDQLVDEELLWQEAVRLGFTATRKQVDAGVAEARARFSAPGEFARRLERAGLTEETFPGFVKRQASIQNLLERRVWKGLRVPDREVHAFYAENPGKFAVPEQVHARHVLLQADAQATPEERARARAAAEEVRALLLAGADFESLARERSQDASGPQGGDLGWVSRGAMVPGFEEAAFALGDGETSGVVETAFGFHVIRVEGRRGGGTVPEKEAAGAIRAQLLADRQKAAVAAALDALHARARIELAEPP